MRRNRGAGVFPFHAAYRSASGLFSMVTSMRKFATILCFRNAWERTAQGRTSRRQPISDEPRARACAACLPGNTTLPVAIPRNWGTRSAEMVVNLKYQSPGTKEFTIRSSTGSKLIIDTVFKKLLQAEQEALGVEAQRRTALNRDNYDFTLVGYDSKPSGSMYILGVKPRTNGKFLYHGRIWVDARDFAVTRLEAQPAKNPSFWTKHSEIGEIYMKVGDFWLPARNHSITNIRFGGRAVLTIQYQNYEISSADAVSNLR